MAPMELTVALVLRGAMQCEWLAVWGELAFLPLIHGAHGSPIEMQAPFRAAGWWCTHRQRKRVVRLVQHLRQ